MIKLRRAVIVEGKYDKIKLSGGIISELMPGTDPQKMFFPMRNRIISGLFDIVVIV